MGLKELTYTQKASVAQKVKLLLEELEYQKRHRDWLRIDGNIDWIPGMMSDLNTTRERVIREMFKKLNDKAHGEMISVHQNSMLKPAKNGMTMQQAIEQKVKEVFKRDSELYDIIAQLEEQEWKISRM